MQTSYSFHFNNSLANSIRKIKNTFTKKKIAACALLFFLFSFSHAQQPKLYVYLLSHGEDNLDYLNGSTGYNDYLKSRNNLTKIAELVEHKYLAYNYGTDYIGLLAMAKYDTGSTIANTNNKNILKWMQEDKGIECDPHSHENAYNYSDIAYLMTQLGVTPTNTISGFIYDTLQNGHNWENYQSGVAGDSFPNYTWYPEILWGAGSFDHKNDPYCMGVYKPKSMKQFMVNEPSNHLMLCGTGCKLTLDDTSTFACKFQQIKNTVNAIKNGTVSPNGIYTQQICFKETSINEPWLMPLLTQLADSINGLVKNGAVEWKNISQIVDYWKTVQNEQAFAIDCDYNDVLSLTTSIESSKEEKNANTIFPNPGKGSINFKDNIKHEVSLYNDLGALLSHQVLSPEVNQININDLPSGIYYISVNNTMQKYILLK